MGTINTAILPFMAAAAPIAAIAGAIALSLYSFNEALKLASDKFEETGSMFQSINTLIGEFVNIFIGTIGQGLTDLTAWVAEKLGFDSWAAELRQIDVTQNIRDMFNYMNVETEKWFRGLGTKIGDVVGEAYASVEDWFTGISNSITGAVTTNIDEAKAFIEEKYKNISNFLYNPETGEVLGMDIGSIFDGAAEWVQGIPDSILEKIQMALDPLITFFDGVGDKIGNLLPDWDWLKKDNPESPEEDSSWFNWGDEKKPNISPSEQRALELQEKIARQEEEIERLKEARAAQPPVWAPMMSAHTNVRTDNTFHTSQLRTLTP